MLPLGAYFLLFQSMISLLLVSGRQLDFSDSVPTKEKNHTVRVPLRKDPELAVGCSWGHCHTRVWCHIPGSMQDQQEVTGLGSLIMANHQQTNSDVSYNGLCTLEYVLEGMLEK